MKNVSDIKEKSAIAIVEKTDPGIVLLDAQQFDVWYDKLKAKAPIASDMSTRKDREALRSYAAEVRSEKAGIDKARLRLTKEWRDMTAQANAAGKVIEERLEALAAEVRAPLTEWEAAEKARVAECEAITKRLADASIVAFADTADAVRARGMEVWNTALDPERFGDLLERAEQAKAHSIDMLKTALVRLEREEAERAELVRLRAENEAREARECADREANEQAEREAEAARHAEQRKLEEEKLKAELIARAQREAAERAQRETEASFRREREEAERRHQEELATERRRAEQAERSRQAEANRIAEEEAARAKEIERVSAEQRRREADKAHRTKVKTAAKTAIMSCGTDDETARKIVIAIIAGEVPAVKLEF